MVGKGRFAEPGVRKRSRSRIRSIFSSESLPASGDSDGGSHSPSYNQKNHSSDSDKDLVPQTRELVVACSYDFLFLLKEINLQL